jgi:predicted nucleic acid-binding Zn ribbon protein
MAVAPVPATDMTVSDRPTEWLAMARRRHRYLVNSGFGLGLVGTVLAVWIAYEWFARGISHEILALLAGFAVLLGVQLLVLSTLTSLLVDLHEAELGRGDEGE